MQASHHNTMPASSKRTRADEHAATMKKQAVDIKVNRSDFDRRGEDPFDREQVERGFKAAIQDASNHNFFLKNYSKWPARAVIIRAQADISTCVSSLEP